MLTSAALLRHPNPANPIALTTDASNYAVGGVIEEYVDGAWVPLAFWSKHLQPSQQKYSTYKRELLAIRLAIRNFLPLFYGRRLIIFTDHQSLCNSFQNQSLHLHSPIENNWIQEISQFSCDVRYLPAKSNQVSDFLSRPFNCPEPTEYVNVDDFIASLEIKINNFIFFKQ